MRVFRPCILLCICLAPLPVLADGTKKTDNTWAKIIVELVTPEMSKKGLEAQEFSLRDPDTMLNFMVKKLGGEGKFSIKAITKKFGAPTKIEKYATKEDGKIVSYQEFHYPPISFTAPVGSDQATLISAPKKLWGGSGILENARKALKTK
jgi:hypothetical protein